MLIWSVELKKWSPCHYRDSHYKDNMTSRPFYLIIPPHNEVVEGYICFTPSVSPTSRVCSVAPTVLDGSISYLYLLSSRFAVSKLFRKISKFEFLANLKKITLTLSSLTWDLMWITSMGNHGVGWWGLEVSQNAGVLVVLIIIGIPWLEIASFIKPSALTKLKGYTGSILCAVCFSGCLSVWLTVCVHNRVRSAFSPKPSRSIWWLKILSNNSWRWLIKKM